MQPDGHQYVVNLKEAHFYQKCHEYPLDQLRQVY